MIWWSSLSGLPATATVAADTEPTEPPSPGLAVVYIEDGERVPHAGFLYTRTDNELVVTVLARYPTLIEDLAECRGELSRERVKPHPFYRRLSFWVPTAGVSFTVGLVLGLLR